MRLLSADGHIDLMFIPEDIFYKSAPPELKDRVPRIVETGQWEVQGKRLFQSVRMDREGVPKSRVTDRMKPTGIFDNVGVPGLSRPATPHLRIEDQERDGIEGDVIYGLLGVDGYMKDDVDAFRFCMLTYYKWAMDFANSVPGRFAMLGAISGREPLQAAEDVHLCAELGMKGVELRPGTASKPFWHDDWEPLWEAVVKTGMPVHFHSDILRLKDNFTPPEGDPRTPHYKQVTAALLASLGKMMNAEALGTMILSGVLERHPQMTLVMGETDISWIPHFLERMDYCVTEREHTTGLPLLPSEYWKRQCKATFQSDKIGVGMIGFLGVDNVMWGNDYPHPDGVWPNSQNLVADQGAVLTEADRHQVFYANTARLYGIGEQAHAARGETMVAAQ